MKTRLVNSDTEWRKLQMVDLMKCKFYEVNAIYDISVIIPVYNVKTYLSVCLNSVLTQSKKNIEIICVDDCSTDASLKVLEDMALKDKRIRVIQNQENRGLLYTRKQGVLAATGKYIMFLDGDDFYSENTCEMAYSEITKSATDILQFGINVINAGNAPQFEVDSFCKFVTPYQGNLYNASILSACFDEEKYSYNLVNKIYNADLCKKAFSYLDDRYYYSAEDMLAYFVLAYFSESFAGISDNLYNYNFAIGISKPGPLDLDSLDKRCAGADSIAAIKKFLETQNTFEQYKDIYTKIERRILSDNFDAWYYRLPVDKRKEGYSVFEKYWGKDKVILGLLYDIENKQFDIDQKARKISESNHMLDELKNRNSELVIAQRNLFLEIENREHVIRDLNAELVTSESDKHDLQDSYIHILNSLSYKLGCMVTWIPRKIAKIIRYIRSN